MISRIETFDKKVSSFLDGKGDITYKNYCEVFTEKFVVLEEMIEVMVDDKAKQEALSVLLIAYKEVRNGLYNDLKARVSK